MVGDYIDNKEIYMNFCFVFLYRRRKTSRKVTPPGVNGVQNGDDDNNDSSTSSSSGRPSRQGRALVKAIKSAGKQQDSFNVSFFFGVFCRNQS